MKAFVAFLLFFLPVISFALTLKTPNQVNAYWFYNKGQQEFWITHPITGRDPGANAGWDSQISPGKYSVILLPQSQHGFKIACSKLGAGEVKTLDCKQVLAHGSLLLDSLPKNFQQGGFWAAENLSIKDLKPYLRSRGIILSTK